MTATLGRRCAAGPARRLRAGAGAVGRWRAACAAWRWRPGWWRLLAAPVAASAGAAASGRAAEGRKRAGERAEAGRSDPTSGGRHGVSVPAADLRGEGPERPSGGRQTQWARRPAWWPTRASPKSTLRLRPESRRRRDPDRISRCGRQTRPWPARRRAWRLRPAAMEGSSGASSSPPPGRWATSRSSSTPSPAVWSISATCSNGSATATRSSMTRIRWPSDTASSGACEATTTTATPGF